MTRLSHLITRPVVWAYFFLLGFLLTIALSHITTSPIQPSGPIALTCCCNTPDGGLCCNDDMPQCMGPFVPGCFCGDEDEYTLCGDRTVYTQN